MVRRVALRRRAARTLAAVAAAALLAGCEGVPVAVDAGKGDIRNAIARGTMTSPRAATVALVSLDGAPPSVDAAFRQALTREAAGREITMTDVPSARYLLRGYLSAYPEGGGVVAAYTYDVFDAAGKRRQARVSDTLAVPAQGDDPWTALSPSVVASLAGRSADDLAATLAGTPEAQATRVAQAAPSAPVQTPASTPR